MKTYTFVAVVGALALTSACQDSLSAPSQDQVVAGTQQPLQNLVTGIVAQDRTAASTFAYLLYPETEARNSVRIDPNEPRFINDLIANQIDPSNFIGVSGWTTFYAAIRATNSFIVGKSLSTSSAGDQAVITGFVQTMKALDYIRLIQLRDTLGVAIQGQGDPSTPDPLRTKTAVLAYISALLDSANNSLTAAGVSATLPVALPSGFKANGDYSTTANLSRFNRGLKGMVEVYRGLDHQSPCAACFATAITALNSALAGISATPSAAELAAGPYYQYNPSAPETFASPLDDNHIYLTDNFAQSIQAGDARASKIVTASSKSSTVSGLSLTYRDPITDPSILANQTRMIPIARNALFLLTRAQAEAESGNLVAATADVNAVHVGEGGLAALGVFASLAEARQAILYEYRYSFIYEGPYHLVALREYSGVTRAYVTQPGMPTVASDPAHAADPLQTTLPIPATEAAARGGNVTPTP